MQGLLPVCKEEEEARLCVILQEQSMKAGCELIVLLVTGLLNSSRAGRKRSRADDSGVSHVHCDAHLPGPG